MFEYPKDAIDAGERLLQEIPRARIPRHIAVIMDGNGRWAQRQGQQRIDGHQRGALTVRLVTEACARLDVEQLTLYCLSSENWKRPQAEIDFLMELLKLQLKHERPQLVANNIRLSAIGRLEQLPPEVQTELQKSLDATANSTGIRLCLAINYGGRSEIVDAARKLAMAAQAGSIDPREIDESMFAENLYTRGMLEPDLLIRTAGEMRISNYLLWQISYSELWVTEKMWPEFDVTDLHDAIRSFAARERRFGGLDQPKDCPC